MNAALFALAFISALNPKLLGLDLLLIGGRQPQARFACLLLGGMIVALAIGLVDVLMIHAAAVKPERKIGAWTELALGLLLLAIGGLLATGRLHGRPPTSARAGTVRPRRPGKKGSWAARMLAEPQLGLVLLVGALTGLPGVSYLIALHNLTTGKYATVTLITAVVVFVVIEFLPVIIPLAFLELHLDATKALLERSQSWLLGHGVQLITSITLALGAYMMVIGLIRLS